MITLKFVLHDLEDQIRLFEKKWPEYINKNTNTGINVNYKWALECIKNYVIFSQWQFSRLELLDI